MNQALKDYTVVISFRDGTEERVGIPRTLAHTVWDVTAFLEETLSNFPNGLKKDWEKITITSSE